jgi:hypothetical protein
MTTGISEDTVEIHELTADQGRELLDRQARRYLGMSGAEFIAAWEAGKFNGRADSPAVVRVAMLLPFGR